MKFYLFKKNNHSGLSILEVVIAIGIIAIGMIAVVSFITQSIQAYAVNKNRFIASLLSQEGIELVRNQRDDNWLDGVNWKNEIDDASYVIDRDGIQLVANSRLKIDGSGLYQHTDGTNTLFTRVISTNTDDCPDVDDCLYVTSEVTWSIRGNDYNYQLETYLYNW